MKLGTKDSPEGLFMKRLLLTCILIMGSIFITGCIGEEKTDTDTPASSQISPESDDQTPDLILKPSDVPGLTLIEHHFKAVPKSNEYNFSMLQIDKINETTLLYVFALPGGIIHQASEYQTVLPLGTRNIGQYSLWGDESGRKIEVCLVKIDSDSFSEYFIKAWDELADHINQHPNLEDRNHWLRDDEVDYMVNNKVDVNIGDCCYYHPSFDHQNNPDVEKIDLVLIHKNCYVTISIIDEKDKSVKEAKRIAKIIKSRLD